MIASAFVWEKHLTPWFLKGLGVEVVLRELSHPPKKYTLTFNQINKHQQHIKSTSPNCYGPFNPMDKATRELREEKQSWQFSNIQTLSCLHPSSFEVRESYVAEKERESKLAIWQDSSKRKM